MMQDNKLKVLSIMFNDLGIGGIQSQQMVLVRQLKDLVSMDAVVFTSKSSYFEEEYLQYGKIFRSPNYEGENSFRKKIDYYIRYSRIKKNIYKIIKENGPYEAVHIHAFFESAPCAAAAKKANVPIRIIHSHNTAIKLNKKPFSYCIKELYRKIYRKIILKNGTHFVACSRAAADYLFGTGIGTPIYNSVNIARFNPSLYPCESQNKLRLIHVGNFTPQKNQLFLLDVLKSIISKHPSTHLTLIGRKDAYFDMVEEKIKKHRLEPYVTILPNNTNVAEALSQADFFVFPSAFEGFGNVMLEAQAMGLKCFASTEVSEETNCGLATYIPLNAGADVWADTILKAFEIGVEKRPADMSRFTEENFAGQFLKIYRGET